MESLLQKHSGELHVDLVGLESAYVPAGGVVSALCNIATHCHSMAKKEMLVFEEHRCIHDFARTPHQANDACSFPFSIYLPGNLPPSMVLDDMEGGGSCGIQYQLTARLGNKDEKVDGKPKQDDDTVLDLHAEHSLRIVGATLSCKKYPYVMQPTVFPVRASLQLPRGGYWILAARVENTHVGKGEDLHLSLSCRNRSEHYIHSVDVRLLETVHWNSSTGAGAVGLAGPTDSPARNGKTFTLASYTNLVLDGLHNENQDKSSADFQRLPHKINPLECAEMHNDLMSECNTVSIRLPTSARDTYTGKLVQVSHCLRISISVKNKASDPQVDIPIRVYDPPMETHSAHVPVPSRTIESIATTKWVDRPAVMHVQPSYSHEAT